MAHLTPFLLAASNNISRKLQRRDNVIMASSSKILQDVMIIPYFLAFIITLAAIGKNAHSATINF